MTQSSKGSIAEVATNLVIGYVGNVCLNMVVLPYFFGVSISIGHNIGLGIIYTIWSVIRSYGVRRLYNRFNWFSDKGL